MGGGVHCGTCVGWLVSQLHQGVAMTEMLTAGYCVPSASDPRNFPEDYKHENGCYSNICAVCANEFIGYKRRRVCKVCLEANGKQDRKPLPREEVDNILESLGFVEHQERADFINGFRNAELAHGIGDKQ